MITASPSMAAAFVQAAHVSQGSNLPITRIVIHGTVSRTFSGGAAATAAYFQSPASGGSAQYIVDPTTVVQCVAESAISWNAPPNPGSIGIELCDLVDYSQAQQYDAARFPTEAAWNARWDLPEFDSMLRLAAALTREMADKYSVPLTKLSAGDLLAGKRGICGHIDVSQAWHQTDHHDPGTTFPWARFMGYVTNAPTPIPTPPKDVFLMALTDAQQAALVSQVGSILSRVSVSDPKDSSSLMARLMDTQATTKSMAAQVAALTTAVAALANDPDLTADQMTKIVTDAITAQVQVTGSLTVSPKASA